jgi:hypothetical protein
MAAIEPLAPAMPAPMVRQEGGIATARAVNSAPTEAAQMRAPRPPEPERRGMIIDILV